MEVVDFVFEILVLMIFFLILLMVFVVGLVWEVCLVDWWVIMSCIFVEFLV